MGRRTYTNIMAGPPRPPSPPTPRKIVTVEGVPDPPPSVNFPLANLGVPIPYVLARQRILSPNIAWIGNIRPVIEERRETREEENETIITIIRSIVGYNVSMMLTLCLGPGVVLKGVYADNTAIWTGTAGPARTVIPIAANESFLNGNVIFHGGDFDQAVDPFMQDFIPPHQLSGHPGICYVIFQNVRLDQLGSQISFEVERFPDPLTLGSDNRKDNDINIATAIYDYLTSDWGGCSIPASSINEANFVAKAAQLADEDNFCALYLQTTGTPVQVLNILTEQMDGCLFENPSAQKIEIALFRRSNYNPSTAHRLSPRNITSVNGLRKNAWPNTLNKMVLSFTNREKAYTSDSITAYSRSAAIDGLKASRPATVDYPACMSDDLASKLLVRDLSAYSRPSIGGTIETDRRAAHLLPGDSVSVNLVDDTIPPNIGYVRKIQKPPLNSNRVVLEYDPYTQTDGAISFGEPETGIPVPIDLEAKDPETYFLTSAPPVLSLRGQTAEFKTNWFRKPLSSQISPSYAGIALVKAEDSLQSSSTMWGYTPNGDQFAPIYDKTRMVLDVAYSCYAQLDDAIDKFDGAEDWIIPELVLNDVSFSHILASAGLEGIRDGQFAMYIFNTADIRNPGFAYEMLSFEQVAQTGLTEFTFTNVHRGLYGSVPIDHAVGSHVFIMTFKPPGNQGLANGFTTHGNLTRFKLTGNAIGIRNAAPDPLPTDPPANGLIIGDQRTYPFTPVLTHLEGQDRSDVVIPVVRGQPITAEWKVRSRVIPGVARVATDDSDLPETDATTNFMVHQLMIRDSANALKECGETLDSDDTQTSHTGVVDVSTALGLGFFYTRAKFTYLDVNDGEQLAYSMFRDELPVVVLETLPYIVESDSPHEDTYYISEDGLSMYISET
jgi:hypothetical protein